MQATIRVYELNRGLFWFDVPEADRIVGSSLKRCGLRYSVTIGVVGVSDGALLSTRSYTVRVPRVAKRQELLDLIASRAAEAGVPVVKQRINGDG